MKNLSFAALGKIGNLIEEHFNAIAVKFLGMIPRASKNKRLTFSIEPDSITSLFIQALGTEKPTQAEEDTLKSLLMIADSYVDALKDRTKAQVMNDISAYVSDMSNQNKPINMKKIGNIFEEKMDKAKTHFEMIAGVESNKASNTGTALQIVKVAENAGDNDPTAFFIVTVDDRTGPYEFILHLLPDGVTPRLWKLSEITSSYYKPGDQYPSLCGLHPNCRCKITYLPPGYGFDSKGKIQFIALGHNELKSQREKHGLPGVPAKISKKKSKELTPA